MNELTEERLGEIEARCQAATPGPWGHCTGSVYSESCHDVITGSDGYISSEADCEFVSHAREDIPALVAEVRRLREQCTEAIKSGDEWAYAAGRRAGFILKHKHLFPQGALRDI